MRGIRGTELENKVFLSDYTYYRSIGLSHAYSFAAAADNVDQLHKVCLRIEDDARECARQRLCEDMYEDLPAVDVDQWDLSVANTTPGRLGCRNGELQTAG
jgi:hypothetical protein